jgi:hypothetical protein
MRKLALKLDDLAVETFTTGQDDHGEGTVHARSGECGSSGLGRQCDCWDTPADPTFVFYTCETGVQDQCGCVR